MKRRKFIKTSLITAGGMLAAPYILPTGRLFAATGTRLANHVVLALFAGGIRNKESVLQNDGNLMPNMLDGASGISPDIEPGIKMLSSAGVGYTMQSKGTLFKDFRYGQGPTGHFNGHTVAITGKYTDTGLNLRNHPQAPTVFEYYRKHTSPDTNAKKAWWISNSLGSYPYLEYSIHPDYGAKYAANYVAPLTLFNSTGFQALGNPKAFSDNQNQVIDKVHDFLNGGFGKEGGQVGFQNTTPDKKLLKEYLEQVIIKRQTGQFNFPLANNLMNGDAQNVFYATEIIKEYKPELTVVNMTNVDIAHSNFTGYCDNLHRADYMMGYLWKTIQETPGMADDTVLIIVPEHGRNAQPNTIVDSYGRPALDHTGDDSSRQIFNLMIGPQNKEVVKYNNTISSRVGESIDIVPTIAHILGFYPDIPGGLLAGRPLYEAFV